VKILSRVFRGKFVAALRRAYMRDQLDLNGGSEPLRDPARWHAFIDALFQTDWVVYAKPPSMVSTSPFSGRITPMASSPAR